MAAVFETSSEDDPLGLWTPTTSAADSVGGLSFDANGDQPDPQPAEPVFRVNLPADGASAAQALAAREQYIRSLDAAINNVPARLDGLVARTQERREKAAKAGVSFDAFSEEQFESGPESDLLSLLDDAEAEEKAIVSFGLPETASAALEQARVGFDKLSEQISRELLHFAWVETNVAGALLARTTIGWTGDAQTALAQVANTSQIALHHRNLQIVTQTRNIRLRLFITIATGAAKVSALLTTPTGAVLALPAVYQYVMQIVSQVKQLQSIQSS